MSYTKIDSKTGEMITVFGFEESIKSIEQRYNDLKSENLQLRTENKLLKEEQYKDQEIQIMQKKLSDMHKQFMLGFPVTEEEIEKINEWKDKHEAEAHGKTPDGANTAIGGRYDYIFTPTSIGTIGIIRCNCGAEFCFRDLD